MLNHARLRQLLSREHFSVDGTLIEAWASMKSFRPKEDGGAPPTGGRNSSRDFHGEQRRNDSHASTTDGEARLFRKGAGKEARLCFMGHLLMENRSGLVIAARLTPATGTAEREAAEAMLGRQAGRHRARQRGALRRRIRRRQHRGPLARKPHWRGENCHETSVPSSCWSFKEGRPR